MRGAGRAAVGSVCAPSGSRPPAVRLRGDACVESLFLRFTRLRLWEGVAPAQCSLLQVRPCEPTRRRWRSPASRPGSTAHTVLELPAPDLGAAGPPGPLPPPPTCGALVVPDAAVASAPPPGAVTIYQPPPSVPTHVDSTGPSDDWTFPSRTGAHASSPPPLARPPPTAARAPSMLARARGPSQRCRTPEATQTEYRDARVLVGLPGSLVQLAGRLTRSHSGRRITKHTCEAQGHSQSALRDVGTPI